MPAIIAVTAAYQILDLELRLPVPQHWLSKAVVAAINDQLDDRNLTAYITLAAGAFAYWIGRENLPHTLKEALHMGIKTFIRNIKQEVEEEVKAEIRAEGRVEGRVEGLAEGQAAGRAEALAELRAMPPDEVLAKLGHHAAAPKPERPANGAPPPE